MKNYIQPGETLSLTAPYDVTSGSGLLVGAIFGVASSDALSGAAVEAATSGVFTLAKASGAITAGARVFWDNTNKNVTTTATSNYCIGMATAAAASGDTTVNVWLARVPASGS